MRNPHPFLLGERDAGFLSPFSRGVGVLVVASIGNPMVGTSSAPLRHGCAMPAPPEGEHFSSPSGRGAAAGGGEGCNAPSIQPIDGITPRRLCRHPPWGRGHEFMRPGSGCAAYHKFPGMNYCSDKKRPLSGLVPLRGRFQFGTADTSYCMIPNIYLVSRIRRTLSSIRASVMVPFSMASVMPLTAVPRSLGMSRMSAPAWTAMTAAWALV